MRALLGPPQVRLGFPHFHLQTAEIWLLRLCEAVGPAAGRPGWRTDGVQSMDSAASRPPADPSCLNQPMTSVTSRFISVHLSVRRKRIFWWWAELIKWASHVATNCYFTGRVAGRKSGGQLTGWKEYQWNAFWTRFSHSFHCSWMYLFIYEFLFVFYEFKVRNRFLFHFCAQSTSSSKQCIV